MVNTMTLTLDTEFEINGFKKLPNFLDMLKEFFSLKVFSKYIYTCFLDRAHLSKKNGWADENGEVYIIFTYEEMEKVFGRTQKTIRNYVNELVDNGLIKIKRQGQGNPNKIYVKGFIKQEIEEPKDESLNQVGQAKIELKEVENNKNHRFKDKLKTKKTQKKAFLPNDDQSNEERQSPTYIYKQPLNVSENQINDTNLIKDIKHVASGQNYSTSLENVKSQIKYDELIKDSEHVNLIKSIANCMVDVLNDTRLVIWINGRYMKRDEVIRSYNQLTQEHIEGVIRTFAPIAHTIKKKDRYLKTMLYTAISSPTSVAQSEEHNSNAPYIQRNRFCNFKEEEWDWDEIERLNDEYNENLLAKIRDEEKDSNPQKE